MHVKPAYSCHAAGARGHDLFLDFVGKAYNTPEAYPDLTATMGEEEVFVHKFLLAARAPAIGQPTPVHHIPFSPTNCGRSQHLAHSGGKPFLL